MAVPNELFAAGDVYIDYPEEEIMFHFEHATGKIFRKFYWDRGEDTVPHTSSLFMDSRSYGVATTRERYLSLR